MRIHLNETAWWRLALILVGLLYLLTVPRGWQCESNDEVEYLGLAHALAHDMGYTLNGQPYGYYPPLYPILLSQVWAGLGRAWIAFYVLNAALGWAGLLVLVTWLRRAYGSQGRWAAWFSLFSYYGWSFSTRYLQAEQLYFLLGAIALVELDRALRADRIPWFSWLTVPGSVLLAAMTKASALAVLGSVGLACGWVWLIRRQHAALALAVLTIGLSGAFIVGWELRAQRVAPAAEESYVRWALKWLGWSQESGTIVAQNAGEGIDGQASLLTRAGIMGGKLGSYLSSVVRPPDNFGPLGLLIAMLSMLGCGRLLYERPGNPLVWFVLLSVGLGTMTFWATSYHRYLYPLTPILYLATGAGTVWLVRHTGGRLVLAVLALWGLWVSGPVVASASDGSNAEAVYRLAMGWGLTLAYAGLLLLPWLYHVKPGLLKASALGLLLISLAHNAVLVADRCRRTLADETPRQRGLHHVLACAAWIQRGTPPEARLCSSFPRLVVFLTDRASHSPQEGGDYMVLLGPLRGMTAFRPAEEVAFHAQVTQTGYSRVFSSGPAEVYKAHDD